MKKVVSFAIALGILVVLVIIILNVTRLPEKLLSSFSQFREGISSGVSEVQEKIEQMKPEIRGVTLDWGTVTPETTEILGTISVYNPNSVSIPIKKVACTITMDGINMGSAETQGLVIEKNAEFPIKISAKMDNAKIPAFWVEHIKRNEKSEALIEIFTTFNLGGGDFTFPFSLKRPVETDLLSSLKKVDPIPVEKKVKIPIVGEQTVFKIILEAISGKWGIVTPQSTQIDLSAIIHNDNLYPLVIPKVEYTIESNGITLGSGESESINVFAPKSKNDVNIVASFDTSLMDEWFVTHIRQGEKSTFDIRVSLVFEMNKEILQLLGQDKLSVTVWEGSQNIETDILGKKK